VYFVWHTLLKLKLRNGAQLLTQAFFVHLGFFANGLRSAVTTKENLSGLPSHLDQ